MVCLFRSFISAVFCDKLMHGVNINTKKSMVFSFSFLLQAIFFYWVTSNLFSLGYGFGKSFIMLQTSGNLHFFCDPNVQIFFLFGSVLRKPAVRSFLDLPPIETQFAPAQQPTFNLFGASKSVPAAGSSIAESDRSSSVLSQRFSDLENRAKSRRESQD